MDKTRDISTIIFQGEFKMNIIEEMYNGDLFPVGTYEHCTDEYKKVMDTLTSVEAEMLAAYPQIRLNLLALIIVRSLLMGSGSGRR